MKTNAIIRIALWSIVIIALLGLLLTGIFGRVYSFEIGTGQTLEQVLTSETSFKAERVSKIEIDWAAGSIYIKAGEPSGAGGDITLSVSSTDEKYPASFEIVGNTLKISYINSNFGIFSGSIPSKDLTIYVPQDWFCQELELDGAALELAVEGINIGTLDIDGAACEIDFQGTVDTFECDGASCEIKMYCTEAPARIDLDGASCTLDLTLPEDCGFLVQMDGLGCNFRSDLPYTSGNGTYLYGDQSCKIDADGLSCSISIQNPT